VVVVDTSTKDRSVNCFVPMKLESGSILERSCFIWQVNFVDLFFITLHVEGGGGPGNRHRRRAV
jgi:hypothetical protein